MEIKNLNLVYNCKNIRANDFWNNIFYWNQILSKLAQRYQMTSITNSQNSRRLNSLEDFEFLIISLLIILASVLPV